MTYESLLLLGIKHQLMIAPSEIKFQNTGKPEKCR